MKKTTLVLLLIATLFGCKKTTDLPEPVPGKRTRLLTSRTLNPNGHYILVTCTYLENGLLKKEVNKDEATGLNLIQEYFYLNGIPEYSTVSSDQRKLIRINYSHTNGRMTRMDYMEYDQSGNTSPTFSRSLEYNGNMLSKVTTLSILGNPLDYQTFTFLGENLFTVKSYSANGTIQNLTEYLYDMELNPFRGNLDRNLQPLGISKNNVTRVRYTDYNDPTANSDRRYEYEYNTEKYPLKKSFIGATARELQVTFTYQDY